MRNAEPEHTLTYLTARDGMRILELENRCTGNRTVGSNPTAVFPTKVGSPKLSRNVGRLELAELGASDLGE